MLFLLHRVTCAFPSVIFPADVDPLLEGGRDRGQHRPRLLFVFLFLERFRIVRAALHFG